MNTTFLSVENMHVQNLFEPNNTIAWDYLVKLEWVWDALPLISSYIAELGDALDVNEYIKHGDNIWIHKTATVAPSAFIGKNVIIGANTEVRHCAYIRENALVGENVVIGNSTELKNVILFNNVQVPHFNYVGDSIFGYKSHIGAGVITCNVKNDHKPVTVTCGNEKISTNLKKFGAVLGDFVEVGCNSTLNPGTVIGANTDVYPLSSVRGFIPKNHIFKKSENIVEKLKNYES
ncbi:MAG: UDP-N-acetylglucosamine pyrophosphorylase [Oscillospiraceae bacterium]|jgi:NDP-sugar pyrophosphorylase family protein|nr:UDP-N-acetylglucosamine pyrophosphorylase [Oscillospiraceae bacterium]